MLVETEEGTRGLAALFQAYQRHFAHDAFAVAQKYDYTVSRRKIPFEQGTLLYKEKRIVVSQMGPEISTEFTVFHEMAHHFLHPIAPIFSAEYLVEDTANEIEYWCDHFALAMFFAKRSVFAKQSARLMDEENYQAFLTYGSEAAYDGRDSMAPWRQSYVLSRRIPGMARQFFKPSYIAYKECIVLQHVLLLVSKLVRVRESE
jgi:hypothetical protein